MIVLRKSGFTGDRVIAVSAENVRVRTVRGKQQAVIFHTVYRLTRGKNDLVRRMPPDIEAEYRDREAEIRELQKKQRHAVDEAWRRADPVRFTKEGIG